MIRDAYRFLVPLLLLAALCGGFGFLIAAAVFLVFAGFVVYFFRNPRRDIPRGGKLVVSPADGKVVKIAALPAAEGGGHQISIFLSIFDVHVNRSPISGILENLEYRRGKFRAAFEEKASIVNEQNVLTIRGQEIKVVVRQIAGLIARRVVCWKQPGGSMDRGELFGMIRFGSRVDVLLPDRVRLAVNLGDRVKGGSSVLGEYV